MPRKYVLKRREPKKINKLIKTVKKKEVRGLGVASNAIVDNLLSIGIFKYSKTCKKKQGKLNVIGF